MDREEELKFKGILNGLSSDYFKELLNSLPENEYDGEEIVEEEQSTNWGSTSPLKNRRDY